MKNVAVKNTPGQVLVDYIEETFKEIKYLGGGGLADISILDTNSRLHKAVQVDFSFTLEACTKTDDACEETMKAGYCNKNCGEAYSENYESLI